MWVTASQDGPPQGVMSRQLVLAVTGPPPPSFLHENKTASSGLPRASTVISGVPHAFFVIPYPLCLLTPWLPLRNSNPGTNGRLAPSFSARRTTALAPRKPSVQATSYQVNVSAVQRSNVATIQRQVVLADRATRRSWLSSHLGECLGTGMRDLAEVLHPRIHAACLKRRMSWAP